MRVFVTGGTGAIGRHVVPALLGAGNEVSALARTPERAASLVQQGADPVVLSLFDVAALTTALVGHDAVVNLATAIPPTSRALRTASWRPNERVRTEGSAAVVAAALAAGVGRVVQESVVMIYADRDQEWITEQSPTDDFPIARGNHAAEANVQRFRDACGDGIVLRFGMFYGPGAAHCEEMLAQARHHVGLVLGRPGGFVSSIHVGDAASAVSHALYVPAGTYNVVDDQPLTKRAFADALAAAVGRRMAVRGPGRSALLLGDRLTSLTRSLRVSNGLFRAATNWAPRYPSARQGLLAAAIANGKRSVTP